MINQSDTSTVVRRVLLNGSFAPSVTNFRGRLIHDMIAKGYSVHVSVPDVSAAQRAAIESLGATVHEAPLRRAGMRLLEDLGYYRYLRRLIAELRPELVVGYTIKPNIWGSLAAGAQKVRSVSMVTGLGYTFVQRSTLGQRAISAATRRLYRRATARNDAVIFQNPDDRDDFIAAGCLADAGKARLVDGSGVDTVRFRPTPLPDTPVFLMVARLLVSKGVREFARAAREILARRHDCRFLLAGDLDESPDSIGREELARWQADGIEYLGWVDDVRSAMKQASVFVLPSYREGTPRTVLEAAAMGRPVITTNVPGCRETVMGEQTGLLVAARDSEALRAAMERLADDPVGRQAMGDRGRKYCVARYSVNKVNRTLMGHLGLL